MTRPRPDWRDPVQFVACGFGAGLAPQAPGTFGTLVALPLWWLLQPLPLATYLGVVALLTIVGAVLIVTGVALLSPPLAVIAAGAALAAAGLLVDFDRTTEGGDA